jgi:hypothetical protein
MMMTEPVLILTQDPIDPQKLARALLASAWVTGVTIVELHADYEPDTHACRIDGKTDWPHAFQAMKGFEPALELTVRSVTLRSHAGDGSFPHASISARFCMKPETFAEFLELVRNTRSPSHIVTQLNGRALREYTPLDVFDLHDLVRAAEFSCRRCGKRALAGAHIIRGSTVWCSFTCAELDGAVL